MMEDYGKESWREWPLLQREASFWVDAFTHDLCWIGATMDFFRALIAVTIEKNTQPARDLYFEGKLEDGLPFFERYRNMLDDAEYIHISFCFACSVSGSVLRCKVYVNCCGYHLLLQCCGRIRRRCLLLYLYRERPLHHGRHVAFLHYCHDYHGLLPDDSEEDHQPSVDPDRL